MAELTDVRYEVEEGLAWITIDRPERMNSFRARTVDELIHCFKRAWASPEVGVVCLTGAGDRGFSAGGDAPPNTIFGALPWAVFGTASDGADGLREIKLMGGVALAQQPETARHDGMPRAAIARWTIAALPTPSSRLLPTVHFKPADWAKSAIFLAGPRPPALPT